MIGKLDGCPILASETCALDIIGAKYVRDVENGEVVVFDEDGVHSHKPFPPMAPRPCIFEYIYFSRPDSIVGGRPVYDVRKTMGAQLAREAPAAADVVVPVPDSGVPAAIGYAQASGIPYELGIIRNHYVGRTFIEPTQQIRQLGVRLKHSANRAVVNGKRIVLVDDLIVRGTTSTKIVQMMRDAGATEVHFRIASPPITHPDYYGIDTPERDKLLAANHDLEGMRQFIGADSLAFLSVDGIYRAMGDERRDPARPQFTDHCFTGDYPTPLTDQTARTRRGSSRCWPRRADAYGRLARSRRAGVDAHGSASRPEMSQHDHLPSSGKIALVTGASRGIGYATALALAKAGAHVVAVARTVGGLEELDDAIQAAGGSATLVPLDLRDTDGIERLGGGADRALRAARRPGRQCRRARADFAARPCRAEGLGRGDRGQCHRQLPPDPRDGPAAARIRRRPRGVRHLGRRRQPRAYRGPYAVSKAALDALARTYAAETVDHRCPRQPVQSRSDPHRACAPPSMPGEDPMTLKTAEPVAEKIVALCLPELPGDRQALRLPARPPADHCSRRRDRRAYFQSRNFRIASPMTSLRSASDRNASSSLEVLDILPVGILAALVREVGAPEAALRAVGLDQPRADAASYPGTDRARWKIPAPPKASPPRSDISRTAR